MVSIQDLCIKLDHDAAIKSSDFTIGYLRNLYNPTANKLIKGKREEVAYGGGKVKIKLVTIMIMMFCLATSAVVLCSGSDKVQNVGGDFGRAWLSDYLAENPRPVAPGSNNSSSTTSNNTTADWGGVPKGTPELSSDLVKPQNTPVTPTDWLGSSTITDGQTSTADTSQNGAKQTYFANGPLSPVHKMDESFSQTSGMPVPDANGLINGRPAELWWGIGPAIDI